VTAALNQRFEDPRRTENPWHALWAMMVGFFMILLDATIVAVANPDILEHLDTDYDGVLWVTSAYLLAYAVPLLLAGRLGDRFGPKNLYLVGLAVFTGASLWCGLAGSIEWLVAARVVQGIGAALMTPQTLSTITKIFPPDRRGVALSVWGATAGVATLVGPLAGGVLVDGLGWQWIFIVNVPIGIAGLALAFWFVPVLSTEDHGFDILGVLLSGAGLFLIVFGLQEGQSHDWPWWIWVMVAVGLAFMAGFVYWQSINRDEPLIPLNIFRDKDFSMSNLGISVIAFAVTAMVVPVMFYAQAVCGLSPTRAALLMAPMAIASGVLAPFVGRLVDRGHPRPIVGFGFSAVAIALTWLSVELTPMTPIWRLVLPMTVMGVGMAFIWSPLAATATRNLPPQLAGAGSGVYNTTRQVGGVLGSAGIAAFMTSRMSAELPGMKLGGDTTDGTVAELPAFLKVPFSAALSQSLLLPAFIALFGVVAALFLRGNGDGTPNRPAPRVLAAEPVGSGCQEYFPGQADVDYFPDDDDYVEFTLEWEDEPEAAAPVVDAVAADESLTEPLYVHVEHPLHAPADTWRSGPVESWRSLLQDEPEPQLDAPPRLVAATNGHAWNGFDELPSDRPPPVLEPIGFAHNGFHVEDEQHVEVPSPAPQRQSAGRHSRGDDDDAGTYGKHSMRFRD
jgi:EmrB/QacA subfamily drug resistance transporter